MLRPKLEQKRELGGWREGVSGRGVGRGRRKPGGRRWNGTVYVMLLCSGLNCKLSQGRDLCIFCALCPPHTWEVVWDRAASLRLEQVEDREAESRMRLWEILLYGRTDTLGILGKLIDLRPPMYQVS